MDKVLEFFVWLIFVVIVGTIVWILVSVYKKLWAAAVAARKAAVVAYNRPTVAGVPDMVSYEVAVAGVTFGGRQKLISGLDTKSTAWIKLVENYKGADGKDYPNAVGVFVNNNGKLVQIGWIPDVRGSKRTNMAKMFRDKIGKGKDPVITGWHKVGGTERYPNLGVRLHITNPR